MQWSHWEQEINTNPINASYDADGTTIFLTEAEYAEEM